MRVYSILNLPILFIVTTNWDSLFSRASRHFLAREINPVYDDKTFLQYSGRESPLLLKPHGDLNACNPVVTLKDLYTHEASNPLLAGFVKDLFVTKTLLFIGYGLSDPDFRRYFFRFFDDMRGSRKSHYIVTLGESESKCKFYEKLGLKVINLGTPGKEGYRARYLWFARRLLEDTVFHATDPLTRAVKIGSHFELYKSVRDDLRVRAGLSAIGTPQPKIITGRYVLTVTDAGREVPVHPPWSDAMYGAKLKLNKAFRSMVRSAIKNGHRVRLILATDFEMMQQRACDSRWAACCLDSLIVFFAREEGKDNNVIVVDRDGPYEIQQYIIGHKEVIESRKLVKPEYAYYESRVRREAAVVEDNVRQFDSCFESFRLDVFEKLLVRARGRGFNYLADRIYKEQDEVVWKTGDELRKQADAIARTTTEAEETTGVSEDHAAVRDLVAAAENVIRDFRTARGTKKEEELLQEIRHLLSCEPPYLLLIALQDELVNSVVKEYLLEKWEIEKGQLPGGRSPQIRIRVLDSDNTSAGSVEKRKYHI